jgi:hypothetical protein
MSRGKLIWEDDAKVNYEDVMNDNLQYYPYSKGEYYTFEWAKKYNQRLLSECLHGFDGSAPGNQIWEWNAKTVQWFKDWLAKRDADKFSWWWESYGWKLGNIDDVNNEGVRCYLTSNGQERPHVNVIRFQLK